MRIVIGGIEDSVLFVISTCRQVLFFSYPWMCGCLLFLQFFPGGALAGAWLRAFFLGKGFPD